MQERVIDFLRRCEGLEILELTVDAGEHYYPSPRLDLMKYCWDAKVRRRMRDALKNNMLPLRKSGINGLTKVQLKGLLVDYVVLQPVFDEVAAWLEGNMCREGFHECVGG
jgi:hypothetical protein